MFKASGDPPISRPHSTNFANSGVQAIFLPGCQMPEKSGLPSADRGGGADRLGLPSAVRGTSGVGRCSHCPTATPCALVSAMAIATIDRYLMRLPLALTSPHRGAQPYRNAAAA